MKAFLAIIGIILLFFVAGVVGVGFNLITIPWLQFSSKVQMNRDIVTKTYNADNAIYNYHWFQERTGGIKSGGGWNKENRRGREKIKRFNSLLL